MALFKAALETRHFLFEAYGLGQLKARMALRKGLRTHCENCGVDYEAFMDIYASAIEVDEIEVGKAYRDNDLIGGQS